ncbi:DUF4302 domain-containing protein [Flavobacterium sp. LHD-85]|uniref:DUF4302 domain-containing protein n=1 Tax=Flavobacterium sp. LHD-85 TaxID=3071410 RepID=UPI0027E17027|nr:DUF4302 domain-containing protein [Flavobacterium sp. LHD-85]MDQ6530601.1 DUF4302 domain-containing protein [Flavobacterium sp. LHD-85]
MKIKNIFKYAAAVSFAVLLSACTDTEVEQKFDKTPTERLNAQKEELQKALLSSENGWKAVYFTDNKQLGGFTHLFKFLPDNQVEMASDFNTDTKVYKSNYDIQLGSTVSVVFTTKNRIHLLSDSGVAPTAALRGKGYLGDFQFLYYGQENGDIVFRTNRTSTELRFVKATAEDWTDLSKNFLMVPNIIGRNTTALYRGLEVNDGTNKKTYDFNAFSTVTRYTTATNATEVLSMGIGYTPTGMIVSPPIVVGEQKLSNFIFNSADGSFTATGTNGVSASLKYSDNIPFFITTDYRPMLKSPSTAYGYIAANLSTAPSNSVRCNALLAAINNSLPSTQKVNRVQFTFNDANGDSYIAYTFTGGKTAIYHNITVKEDPANKTLVLTSGTWENNLGAVIPTPDLLKDIDAELTNSKGLYVKKEAFTYNASNKIYTFANANNNGFRLTTYAFQ